MAFRLDPPHAGFLDVVEVMALAGFDELTGAKHGLGTVHTNGSHPGPSEPFTVEPGTAFDTLPAWLEEADPALPLRRVSEGFVLEPREIALLGLLFAAALSEHVARHIAATTNGAGQGIPMWLAQRLIGGLRPDDLAAAGALRRFHQRFAPLFGRKEAQRHGEQYDSAGHRPLSRSSPRESPVRPHRPASRTTT